MAAETVTVTRIYLREGEHLLPPLLNLLHEEKVSGLTVLRGVAGVGDDGVLHAHSLVDLALDLPLVVEFYESPKKSVIIWRRLEAHPAVRHVISWQALKLVKE